MKTLLLAILSAIMVLVSIAGCLSVLVLTWLQTGQVLF